MRHSISLHLEIQKFFHQITTFSRVDSCQNTNYQKLRKNEITHCIMRYVNIAQVCMPERKECHKSG